MAKCSPGMICIENATLTVFVILSFIFIYYYMKQPNQQTIIMEQSQFTRPNALYSNQINDVFMNPYVAPVRDDRYIQSNYGVPINIATQGVDTNYRQVGILNCVNGKQDILPLMGRPLITNRDKWQFYSMNNNNIKLPMSNNGVSCTNEYGCNNLYNGDTVFVEGYNDVFKVTMYENATMKYLPFI